MSILSFGAFVAAGAPDTIFTGMGRWLREDTVGARSKDDIKSEPAAATVMSPNTGKTVFFSMRISPLLQPVWC